jgi:hypothetical protein
MAHPVPSRFGGRSSSVLQRGCALKASHRLVTAQNLRLLASMLVRTRGARQDASCSPSHVSASQGFRFIFVGRCDCSRALCMIKISLCLLDELCVLSDKCRSKLWQSSRFEAPSFYYSWQREQFETPSIQLNVFESCRVGAKACMPAILKPTHTGDIHHQASPGGLDNRPQKRPLVMCP